MPLYYTWNCNTNRRRLKWPRQEQTEHPRHLGRRHRHLEPELLFARADGLPDAQHRPHRQGRDDVHRFATASSRCTAGRSSFITGQSVYAHRPFQGGHSGGADRHEREDHHHRSGAEEPGLRDRAVRQEPPRRPESHAADQPRLRRVLRQPLPPERRGRAGDARLPDRRKDFPKFRDDVRSARRDAFLGDRQGRPDR